MNCPSCQRGNDPRRHYCGGCGTNLMPVCRRCTFVNDAADRYCGGCGDMMMASGLSAPAVAPSAERLSLVPAAVGPRPTVVPPPPRPVAPAPVVTAPPPTTEIASVTPRRSDMITADDLAELLAQANEANAPTTALPSAGAVSQDDLDKLFGGF